MRMKYDQFVTKKILYIPTKKRKIYGIRGMDKPISYLGPSLVDAENLSIDAFI